MANIFTIIKQNKKDPEDWHVVAQTTDTELAASVPATVNDNSTFIKKKDGSIIGDKSIIEIFDKDEPSIAFRKTEDI